MWMIGFEKTQPLRKKCFVICNMLVKLWIWVGNFRIGSRHRSLVPSGTRFPVQTLDCKYLLFDYISFIWERCVIGKLRKESLGTTSRIWLIQLTSEHDFDINTWCWHQAMMLIWVDWCWGQHKVDIKTWWSCEHIVLISVHHVVLTSVHEVDAWYSYE